VLEHACPILSPSTPGKTFIFGIVPPLRAAKGLWLAQVTSVG
jgi:hypothetical protein